MGHRRGSVACWMVWVSANRLGRPTSGLSVTPAVRSCLFADLFNVADRVERGAVFIGAGCGAQPFRRTRSPLDLPEPFDALGVERTAAANRGRVHHDRGSDCLNDRAAVAQ